MRAVGLGLLVHVALLAAAHAQPTVHPGPQLAPPVRAGDPVLPQQLDGRRSVRGCAVDEICGRADAAMRELDVELFPPPGASPWIDEHAPPGSRLEPGPIRTVKKPSELRPDAPWLDQLELPDLPVRWSQKLVDYLVFYRNDPRGRAIISGWLRDQGRYRDMMTSYLRKAHLPQDLIYVAMIESSYDPNTLSSAGALGLWQFMPEGGRIYGLRQDRWVDERKDPLRATIAQMDYFRDLYQRFGDWHIALASFNVGYGAMLRSIARYNTNDYYKLCEYENAIPWETCLYTPKVLATAIVGHNRALFGMEKLEVKPAEIWDEVSVPVSVTVSLIARAANTSEAEIKKLNPHLRRNRTPPGETGYIVRVPRGSKNDTVRRLVELQSDWDTFDAHVVAHGERFEDVATTYGISRAGLRKLNGVDHEAEITGGTVLVVPRISAEQRTKNQAKAKAKLLGSGIDQKDGEALIVPIVDKHAAVAGKRRAFYRVVTGDTVKAVAKAFGATREQLIEWNGLDEAANLHPKMVLVAFVAPDFDAAKHRVALLDESQLIVVTRGSNEHLDLAEARTGRVRTEYVAKGKEKLADVAKRYGMGSHDLARINRISYNTVLEKGDKIIVYEVTDPKRSERAEAQWKKTPKAKRGKVSGQRETTASVEPDEGEDSADETGDPSEAKPEAKKTPAKKTDGVEDSDAGVKPTSKKVSETSESKPEDSTRKAKDPRSSKADAKKSAAKEAETKRSSDSKTKKPEKPKTETRTEKADPKAKPAANEKPPAEQMPVMSPRDVP